DGGNAYGVAVGSDGTVFLANTDDGLRAYTYDGSSFTNTAHIDDGGTAYSVALGPDGTVFLANGNEGMFAYTYSPVSGIDAPVSAVPGEYALSQNWPNPFNASTKISFDIPNRSEIALIIYDITGQEVRTLASGTKESGRHEVVWNGENNSGGDAGSGLYIYRLESGDQIKSCKMLLVR
ncbi:MAG TPA: FlgD immunoglobulin-like domain containing protein, partial [bacterium]|nr:FlgD immunoglobulin-like domain containing protein [bacterium]